MSEFTELDLLTPSQSSPVLLNALGQINPKWGQGKWFLNLLSNSATGRILIVWYEMKLWRGVSASDKSSGCKYWWAKLSINDEQWINLE